MTAITCWCRPTRGTRSICRARSVLALPQSRVAAAANRTGNRSTGCTRTSPEMQGFFNNQKSLAILANVGTLVQPTTQATYRAFSESAGKSFLAFRPAEPVAERATCRNTGVRLGRQGRRQRADVQRRRRSFRRFSRFPGNPVFCTGITTRPFSMDPGQPPGPAGIRFVGGIASPVCRDPAIADLRQRVVDGAGGERGDGTSGAVRAGSVGCAEEYPVRCRRYFRAVIWDNNCSRWRK